MPCNKCTSYGTRQRWTSNGPRLIHGVQHSVFLYYFEYQCTSCKSVYKSIDSNVRNKLHPKVQLKYPFYTTANCGVTNELLQLIVSSRAVSLTSLTTLRKNIREIRYERMFKTIIDYNYHCDWYRKSRGFRDESFEELPPILTNPTGYHDHEPISVNTMGEIYREWCSDNMSTWSNYTQQLTADQVSIDSSHKIPKRVTGNAFGRLWSMVDISTGVILQQQMLTNETNEDILPMLKQHVARCISLDKPVPSRVCSDRGLMDANLIKHVDAFPCAHINVDPWHFQQLFMKTLNPRSKLKTLVHQAFKNAMYKDIMDAHGFPTVERTLAEPEAIITAVDGLIDTYKSPGEGPPAVTLETIKWWAEQCNAIRNDRICSNPINNTSDVLRVSSSAQENYHRQINRATASIKLSQDGMHALLQHFNFRWNVARRRQHYLEYNYVTYNIRLVHQAFTSCKLVAGHDNAMAIWNNKPWLLPDVPSYTEDFGLIHPHVTMSQKISETMTELPLTDNQLSSYLSSLVYMIEPAAVIPLMDEMKTDLSEPPVSDNTRLQQLPTMTLSNYSVTLILVLMKNNTIFRNAISNREYKTACKYYNVVVTRTVTSKKN